MRNTTAPKTITLTVAELAERAALAAEFAAEIVKCDDCGTELPTGAAYGSLCVRCSRLHKVMGR